MKKKDCINNLLFGRQLTLYFTFACVICLITGCHRSADSPELLDIYDYVSDNPQKALGALDSIDYCRLSSANRHFHDFLTIKAKDKAYISHTGDSIILDVISYYADKGDVDIYAETLYYGGRVYSDLGDYPTSLRFFQKALDILPDKQENLYMRANIVSQLGRLLHKLSLYDEARKYISMSIEIDKQLCDTINTIYDLQLLGFISIRTKEYDFAEQALHEALSLSNNQPEHLKAKSLMYLAEAKYKCGKLDSAINFIRNTPDLVQQRLSRNYALGYAARIYKDAGITDTAYIYAHEIINSPNPGPRELAYHVLLSPEIRKMIPQDTLDKYISEYVNLLEEYSEHDKIQFAINQQNLYNYELHERDKIKAQKSNEKLRSWSVALVLLSFVLATVVLYLKNRSKARILELQEAIDNIKKLKAQLEKENAGSLSNNQLNVKVESTKIVETQDEKSITQNSSIKKEASLREQLRKEIIEIYETSKDKDAISDIILQSDVYKILKEKIARKEVIKEDDNLWYNIEETILKCSPKFMDNLNLLAMGHLTRLELHTIFLIKCGLKPASEMPILLGRSQGTVVSRRQAICIKLFGETMNVKVLDAIIRQL